MIVRAVRSALCTLADIKAAAEVAYRDFAATPQYHRGLLSQGLGTDWAPTAG